MAAVEVLWRNQRLRALSAVEELVAAAPDGVYRFTDALDGDGITGAPVQIAVELRKAGDRLVIDLSACADQTTGPVNASRGAVRAALSYFAHMLAPQAAATDGSMVPITLVTRPGSIVDPSFPAPVNARTNLVKLLANALLGLPPVVVGLALYLLLSHAGPLGGLGLLFTPAAMVLAQTVLALPIVAALAHRVRASAWSIYGHDLQACGASRWHALPALLLISHRPLATALLAGFGRTLSEVGAVLIVGGNIAGATRSMTTAIALETSKGNLSLALGLGGVLLGISLAVSASVLLLTEAPSK